MVLPVYTASRLLLTLTEIQTRMNEDVLTEGTFDGPKCVVCGPAKSRSSDPYYSMTSKDPDSTPFRPSAHRPCIQAIDLFGLASNPLGEDSPCHIISIRLPQKKPPFLADGKRLLGNREQRTAVVYFLLSIIEQSNIFGIKLFQNWKRISGGRSLYVLQEKRRRDTVQESPVGNAQEPDSR
jgi:hypothetical protein